MIRVDVVSYKQKPFRLWKKSVYINGRLYGHFQDLRNPAGPKDITSFINGIRLFDSVWVYEYSTYTDEYPFGQLPVRKKEYARVGNITKYRRPLRCPKIRSLEDVL